MTTPVYHQTYKRLFDLIVMMLAHLILLPVWIILWVSIPIIIWISDRGPIFFKQYRCGHNGKAFFLYKFRTMVKGASNMGPSWTTKNDPRITRFGRILRKTALDELPGTISIWFGTMSLVGPRALSVEEQKLLENEIPGFSKRLIVKPGLTGLAQLYNITNDSTQKLNYDMKYIQTMSIWLDIKILFLSITNTIFVKWDHREGNNISKPN